MRLKRTDAFDAFWGWAGFRGSPKWRKFLRSAATAYGAEHRGVGQFLVSRHAAQQETAATQVSAPDEIAWETQPLAEMREQAFHIFSRGDAPQKDDFIDVQFGQRGHGGSERSDIAWLGNIDRHGGEFPEASRVHRRVPAHQPAGGRDDQGAGRGLGRLGEAARVGQLSAKIKAAAKGEHFAQRGVPDLHAPGQLESGFRPQKHLCPESARVRGREKKHALHGSKVLRAGRRRDTKLTGFIMT